MRTETPPFRVRYADTDAQAVAYYGSYFTWLEVGLIHILGAHGIHLPALEREGRVLMTVETYARFRRPAVYDDLLVVRSRVAQAAAKRVGLEHEIVRAGDGRTLALGRTANVLVRAADGVAAGEHGEVLPVLAPLAAAADSHVGRVALTPRAEALLGPTPPGAPVHTCGMQVRYAETDAQGVAYYGSYYAWFEEGRSELTRRVGLPYRELERRGVFLPVVEAYCRHFAPLRACESFRVTTAVAALGNARITFTNRIRSDDDQRAIAAGYTIHACTGPDGKPHGLPREVVERFGPPACARRQEAG